MSVKEVDDLLFAALRIDRYGNFYFVVVIAVIGWLASLKKNSMPSMKLLVSIAHLIATIMNSYSPPPSPKPFALPPADTRILLEQPTYFPRRFTDLGVRLVIMANILSVGYFAHLTDAEPATPQVASSKTKSESSHEERAKV